ncbi:hypothetical protein FANTH_12109 [Fusarium anthophilum]|uniref:Uncharacterized protein n=1 Tax=Fusarium anthophilum TaxID=48485 RepID=A0A8H4YUN1_9HYPO|nr:hypothetical protein FANTH_12109 [Fusarium anthophilum]
MSVEDVNKTAVSIINSPKSRQIQAPHHKYIITDYPFVMSNPQYIKVPRGEDPSPDMKQQPAHLSEQLKNWLREGNKDTPWHNIDSIEPTSDTQGKFEVNVAPSETPATQGSNK